MGLPDENTMYEALLKRDSTFEGTFIIGVKTTGIFCRPTCSARKPKMENVEYFTSTKEALSDGYRPCKVCHPMQLHGDVPAWLSELLNEVERTPNLVMKDADLRSRGIDPVRARRWFSKHHGITFQAYLRSLRINTAFGSIKKGRGVTGSAFDAGYESLSGFNESFKKTTGFVPSRSSKSEVILITRIPTPLGPMVAGATEAGLCLLEFADRPMLETQIKRVQTRLKAPCVTGPLPQGEDLSKQMEEYFAGTRTEFDLPLILEGTEFQTQVWETLRTIPFGATRSYEQQAAALGNRRAVRAVARANGDNRISILIPCHRVIAKNGDLTGYGGGVWRKRYLLDLERKVMNRDASASTTANQP